MSGGGLPAHHLREWEKGMRLQANEKFYRIFHWKNTKGMEAPKVKNATEMCTRFYGTGVCFGNCNKAHSVLDHDEKGTWRKYITHCRKNHDKWIESIKQNNSNNKDSENSRSKEKDEVKEAKVKEEPSEGSGNASANGKKRGPT